MATTQQAPKTKEYMIVNVPQTAMYKITLTGGGEISDSLKGSFTSKVQAKRAIATDNDMSKKSRKVAE